MVHAQSIDVNLCNIVLPQLVQPVELFQVDEGQSKLDSQLVDLRLNL